jgi:hypothetical protein
MLDLGGLLEIAVQPVPVRDEDVMAQKGGSICNGGGEGRKVGLQLG